MKIRVGGGAPLIIFLCETHTENKISETFLVRVSNRKCRKKSFIKQYSTMKYFCLSCELNFISDTKKYGPVFSKCSIFLLFQVGK